jgi:hypothetical protein
MIKRPVPETFSRLPAGLVLACGPAWQLASPGCAKHGSPMSNVEVELKTDTGERAPRSAGAATTSHTTQNRLKNRHRMALRSAIVSRGALTYTVGALQGSGPTPNPATLHQIGRSDLFT